MTYYEQDFDFDMLDAKGRRIGARAIGRLVNILGRETTNQQEAAAIHLYVQATHNGVGFGPYPKAIRLPVTQNALKAELGRRLEVMIRRYAKQSNDRSQGSIEIRRDARTGCKREIREAEDRDSGKYEVICWDHGSLVGVETLKAARSVGTVDFCEDCQKAISG